MTGTSRAEFTLELIKVLIWPVILVIGAFWLGPDFRDIIKERNIKIGGVFEVGDRVSNLQNSFQDELLNQKDLLNKILNSAGDATQVKAIAEQGISSLENAQKGVKKEFHSIQQNLPDTQVLTSLPLATAPTPANANAAEILSATASPQSAPEWESYGFKMLLERKVEPAVDAFTRAEKLWPDYHNVAEIRQLLLKNKHWLASATDAQWRDFCNQLVEQYSWGMPSQLRQALQSGDYR